MKECELDLAEASSARITLRSLAPLHGKLAGASRWSGTAEAKAVELDLDGASHAKLGGKATNAKLSGSAASHLTLDGLEIQNAEITLSGGSTATINATSTLKGHLSAGSRLTSRGDPSTVDVKKSGGSTFSRH